MDSICTPAMLYLILSVFAIIYMIANHFAISSIAIKTLFILLWTWFLNFLCTKGHSGISWFLVLLPYVLCILFVIVMHEQIEKMRHDIHRHIEMNKTYQGHHMNEQRYQGHRGHHMNEQTR